MRKKLSKLLSGGKRSQLIAEIINNQVLHANGVEKHKNVIIRHASVVKTL